MKLGRIFKVSVLVLLHLTIIVGLLSACTERTSQNEGQKNQVNNTFSGDALKMAWYATVPHTFFEDVRVGVEAFEKEFGIDVEKQVGPDWKQSSETENVEALAAMGYRLFSIYPTDPRGANALYEELVKEGCHFINFGANTFEPTKAEFYVGTDVKAAAITACEELIKSMDGKGNIINVLEILEDSNTTLRKQAIEEVVRKYPEVHIIEEVAGTKNVEEAVQKISDAISSNIDRVDGIICTGDTTSVGMAQVLSEYKKEGGTRKIHSIGINTDPIVVKAIKDGIIDKTIAQNSYGMGYISCLLLKYIREDWKSKDGSFIRIDTGIIIADKNNIDKIDNKLIKITEDIKTSLEKQYLTK